MHRSLSGTYRHFLHSFRIQCTCNELYVKNILMFYLLILFWIFSVFTKDITINTVCVCFSRIMHRLCSDFYITHFEIHKGFSGIFWFLQYSSQKDLHYVLISTTVQLTKRSTLCSDFFSTANLYSDFYSTACFTWRPLWVPQTNSVSVKNWSTTRAT